MATLGNVIRRIKRDLRSQNGLRVTDDDVREAINDSIRHYEHNRFHFNEGNAENGLGQTIATVAGTASYPMPSLVVVLDEVLYLHSGYDYPLDRWHWRDYVDAIGGSATIRGAGQYYTIHGGRIYLYPTPDQATTITLTGVVRLSPVPMSASSSENGWTTHGLSLIRARASWDLSLNTLGNPDRAMDFKAVERDALAELRGDTISEISLGRAYVPEWDSV